MGGGTVFATAAVDDYTRQTLSRYGEFRVASDPSEQTICNEISPAVALMVRGLAPITKAVIDSAPGLRVIGRTGVGYDNIDVAAATERGIPVVYTPGAGARAVAEGAFTFMLALCKLVGPWDRAVKAGDWESRYRLQGGDLDGSTLGIVGIGRIGGLVAQMAQPFAMEVLAYDPYVNDARFREVGATRVTSLDELLSRSRFLTLHCPLTDETRGMIDRERLSKLPRGAYVVNLARGGVVASLDPLDEMLASGHLAGAALDVFEPEPPDFSHPVFRHENCLTSPHSMATTAGAMARIFRSMTDDMAAVLDGGRPRFVVNPETLERAK